MPTSFYKPSQKVRVIVRPRKGGKTEAVVLLLKKDKGLCLLVNSVARQHQMEQEYPMLIGRVFSNAMAIKQTDFRGIVIDNIEEFLPPLPKPLVAFTVTGEPHEE